MNPEARLWGSSERHSLLWSMAFLLVVLCLRCFKGLDVTDEMQYYGQMSALARSSTLFTTDLFIQQLVYLPFYPLLRVHWLLYGEAGLVLAGRLLLSVLLLSQFWYVQHWFRQHGSRAIHGVLTSLCLTFVATYHGIFAISYNSMSQMAWVVFCLWFMDFQQVPPWRWAALIVLAAFAHPVTAVSMSCLVVVRWGLAQHTHRALQWFYWMVGFGLLAFWLTLSFAPWSLLRESLIFSSGFAVGNALLSQPKQLCVALAYPAMLMLTGLHFFKIPSKKIRWVGFLLVLSLFCGILLFIFKSLHPFSIMLAGLGFCLVAIIGTMVAALRGTTLVTKCISSWPLRIALSVQFLVLTLTSSNGLAQGLGGVMVAVPMLLGLASLPPSTFPARHGGRGLTLILILVLLLYVAHWVNCPYRDQPWYQLVGEASEVAAFKYIDVSSSTQTLLNTTRGSLMDNVSGNSVWIASELPALYFALKVRPSSCMLYMHSTGGPASKLALQSCMATRNPEMIVDIYPALSLSNGQQAVRELVDHVAKREGMFCKSGILPPGEKKASSDFRPSLMPLVVRFCTP